LDQLELEVINILRELKIPAHLKGYQYIITAIKYLIENPSAIHRMMKELYPEVGKAHGEDKVGRVERAIRTALLGGSVNEATWLRVLGRTGPMPNGEFLASLLETVKIKFRLSEAARKE